MHVATQRSIQPSWLELSNTLTASLLKVKTPTSNECPGYDIKQSADEAPPFKIRGMWSTLSLPLLPGPFRLGEVALDKFLSMGQIELFDIEIACKMTCSKLNSQK